MAMAALNATMESTSSLPAGRMVSWCGKSIMLRHSFWSCEPTLCWLVESGRELHFHGIFRKQIEGADLRLRNKGQISGERMNSGRNENHQECCGRIDLHPLRRGPNDDPQGPTSVAGKREGDDRAPAEPRSKLKQVGHTLDGEIDAANQWYLGDPLFNRSNDTTPQQVRTERAGGQDQKDEE